MMALFRATAADVRRRADMMTPRRTIRHGRGADAVLATAARPAAVVLCAAVLGCGAPRTTPSDPPARPAPAAAAIPAASPAQVGMDPGVIQRLDSIVGHSLSVGAAPGAAIAVGRHGRLVLLRGYGTQDHRQGFPLVTDSTLYDVASMTKVVATTTAIMLLIDDGVISLDDRIAHHLPEWRGSPAKESVTIRNLLLHDSGLPAFGPLYRELRGPDQYLRRIAAMSLEYEPGSRMQYSDYGIILLALLVDRLSGQPLDAFMEERIFGPLGMRDTGFNPRVRGTPLHRIAPTEVDTIFRNQHIHGDVHDENAFALGGVAGHAGLFSSARDLARFAQLMLNRGEFGGRRFIRAETVDLFTRRHGAESSRALGWDTPAGTTSAGAYFSSSSYGHTGFTGTSIWIDPQRDLFVVLLTNRVNPTRANTLHIALRRDVADAAQQGITDMPVSPRDP
jgi:CubicO group peptidase (beta-lactamase class C family)